MDPATERSWRDRLGAVQVTRGGPRPGAGRKPTAGPQPRIMTTVTPAELAAIDAARLPAGLTRAAFVRQGAVEMAGRMLKKGR